MLILNVSTNTYLKFYRACRVKASACLTLKASITTAADYKFRHIFPNFRKKEGMIFHENHLPAEASHEISLVIFDKAAKF